MIVTGIILIVASIVIVIISAEEEYENNAVVCWIMGLWTLGGVIILIAGLTKGDADKISLKDNTLEIKIHQEIINGQEISRDTVYIFTPKK